MTHDENILAAIEPLREAGFALHWLKSGQKSPVAKDWQNAPVPSVAELRATHKPGFNLGVRPGEPSNLGGLYLHLIDMDIRIPEMADECWSKLRELLPCDPDTLPMVISGSGGESRHLYFVTDKPFQSRKLAMSEGKVRRWDATRKKDVWSSEWEIELFGTGKQIVLPPSIHPDTGKPYRWVREFDFFELAMGLGPVIASGDIAAMGAVETTSYAYEEVEPLEFKPGQMEAELALIPIGDLHYDDWLRMGQALHHQLGGTEDGFALWLEHSRRSEKHDSGYERTMRRKYRSFGRYRGRPVTMATIRTWAIEARTAAAVAELEDFGAFDDLNDLDEGDAEIDEFEAALGGNPDDSTDALDDDFADFDPNCEAETAAEQEAVAWKSLLDFNEDGGIRGTLHNLRLIVENDERTRGIMSFNEFTQEVVQRGSPGKKSARRKNAAKPVIQLEGTSWKVRDPANGDFWTEDKDNAIRAVIEAPKTQGGYGFKVPDRDLRAAIDIVGRKNGFHPVREYLDGLQWDGTKRVERLFIDYLGAPDDAYTRDVARLMMAAAVTRVFEPGHKFDFAVILKGLQGKRKSTFISTLAKSWFAELEGDIEDPRMMVEAMQGSWILEIPELGGFVRADVRHIKAFISRRSDKVRLAYAKRAQEFHRQCIFMGSTNDDKFLKDDTGGRRFWPIECAVDFIDTERLEGDIDQMWAEARAIYAQMRKAKPRGTLPLYLTDAQSQDIAARLQESARVESADDAIAGQIEAWLARPVVSGDIGDPDEGKNRIVTCLKELWVDCLNNDPKSYNQQAAQTVGRAMSRVTAWKADGDLHTFKKWGRQRAYRPTA